MTDSKIDPAGITPERLAALLDGRLDERERAEVLRALDADPELRAAYADAAAIEGELAAAGASAGAGADVRAFRHEAAPGRWRSGRVMLLAAGLAGVAFLPWAVARSRGGAVEPYALVRQLDVERRVGLPAEPWAVTRGSGVVMSERGRAVRLGARLVDLELAIAAGDSGMRAAAASVEQLAMSEPPLTGAPVDFYRQVAAGDADAARDRGARREGWEALSELAGADAARLGAWLEAARVAAVQRDDEFFRSPATTRLLTEPLLERDAEERRVMQQVRGAVGNGRAIEWAALEQVLTEALQLAGR